MDREEKVGQEGCSIYTEQVICADSSFSSELHHISVLVLNMIGHDIISILMSLELEMLIQGISSCI